MGLDDILVKFIPKGQETVVKAIQDIITPLQLMQVKFEQAMHGFKEQFSSVQKSLKPLGEEVRKSMIEGFVVPSLTAEQATQGILDKQKELANFSNQMNKKWQKMGLTVKNVTDTSKKFRMELLSVMFFGMAISAVFTGMLQPALQLVGLFDLWGSTLQVVFLPIALALLEVFLPIMDWFMNLPEPIQMAIGVFVLFMMILGKLLFLFGTFGLGLSGLNMAFAPFIAAISEAGGWLTWLGGIFSAGFLAILGIVLIAIIGFVSAWKTNFGQIQQWVQVLWIGVKQTFLGITQIFKGFIDMIIGIFSGNTEKVKEGFQLMLFGLLNILTGMIKLLVGLLVTLALSITKVIWNIITTAWDLIKQFVLWVIDRIGWLIGQIGELGGKIKSFFGGGKEITTVPKQTGGFIPHTGLYKLHAGESVNQAGTFNSSPTINVYASAGMDIDRLVREISIIITRDLASMARR